MLEKYELIVLIPLYREEENLNKLFLSINLLPANSAVLFIITIDKDNNDKTLDIVENYCNNNINYYFIVNNKRGLGIAYREGFNYVKNNFNFNYICTLDADGSHGIKYIEKLLKNCRDFNMDIVIASRYIKKGGVNNWSLLRLLGSRAINILINFFSFNKVYDFSSGFKIYSQKIIKKINFSNLKSKGYVFQFEILIEGIDKGAKLKEVPYKFEGRKKGKSKFRYLDFLEYFYILARIFFVLYLKKIKSLW